MVNSCSPVNHVDSPSLQQVATLPPHSQPVPIGVHQLVVDPYVGSGGGQPPASWKTLHQEYDEDDELDDPDGVAAAAAAAALHGVDGLQPTAFQQLVNSFGGGSAVSCLIDPTLGGSAATVGDADDDTVVSFDEPMTSSIVVGGGVYHRGQPPVGGANCLQAIDAGVELIHGRGSATAPFGRHHQHRAGLNVPA
jgi:hypothetical protein